MFLVYFYIIKRNSLKKVKAQVVEEEEEVKNYEALKAQLWIIFNPIFHLKFIKIIQ